MSAPHRIVIVGAGFSGVYAYRNMHRLAHGRRDIHLTLVSEQNYFLFTPLLHEVATGGVAPENIIEPIRDVVGCCVDEFVCAPALSIAFKKRRIVTAAGDVGYDTLVLALGAQTNFLNVPGAEAHSFQLKSLNDAVRLKNHLLDVFERAAGARQKAVRHGALTFAIIGGGPTGVELACELADFIGKTLARYFGVARVSRVRILLVQAAGELVPAFPSELRAMSAAVCRQKGIEVLLNTSVERVERGAVVLSGGQRIPCETAVWVAGIKPRAIACDDAKTKNVAGAFIISPSLQLERYPDVFALGDGAFSPDEQWPQTAQAAVQQARTLARNVISRIDGRPLEVFVFRKLGTLLSLGDYHAAGKIGTFVFSGTFCWWLWRTVYLLKMPTFQKKVKVALDWTFDLFLPRDVSKIE